MYNINWSLIFVTAVFCTGIGIFIGVLLMNVIHTIIYMPESDNNLKSLKTKEKDFEADMHEFDREMQTRNPTNVDPATYPLLTKLQIERLYSFCDLWNKGFYGSQDADGIMWVSDEDALYEDFRRIKLSFAEFNYHTNKNKIVIKNFSSLENAINNGTYEEEQENAYDAYHGNKE